MTNDEIATLVETSDEWIAQRTGHPPAPDRRLTARAAALLGAGRPRARSRAPASIRAEIDLIVAATASPDYYFPATASLIGERHRRAARRPGTTCRRRAPGSSTRWPRPTARSRRAWPTPCWWSARRCSRGSSTGATARPASCSATARARWCSAANGSTTGMLGFELGSDGSGAGLLVGACGRAQHRAGARRRTCRWTARGVQVRDDGVGRVGDAVPHGGRADGRGRRRVRAAPGEPAASSTMPRGGWASPRSGCSQRRQYGNTSAASIPICLDEAYRGGRMSTPATSSS